jgi:hypothetical protein
MATPKQDHTIYVPVQDDEVRVYLREMGRLYRVLMFETRIYTGPSKTAVFETRLLGLRPTNGRLADFKSFYVPYPTDAAPDATTAQYRVCVKSIDAFDAMCDEIRVPHLFTDS